MQPIDLRSDTVTQPCARMRRAMATAPVGDDVIDIDPTIDRLEKMIAERLGKEAAIFMPSGSMTNQIALRIHCRPGDEFICEEGCHIYNYEQGAYAQLSGLAIRTIVGDAGMISRSQLDGMVRPINEHMVRTRLLCLENTHNRAAGRILPFDIVDDVTEWARDNGLGRHLDGARLFNAVVGSGIAAAEWARMFDTVSVCFSKGLGAPVGSALVGTQDVIAAARFHRKCFGGGMRQAGIIAAGAIYALENNVERMSEDHEKAQRLAAGIVATNGISLINETVDTNMVIFKTDERLPAATEFIAALEANGVRALDTGPRNVRLVTHLDVTDEQIDSAVEILTRTTAALCNGATVT